VDRCVTSRAYWQCVSSLGSSDVLLRIVRSQIARMQTLTEKSEKVSTMLDVISVHWS
jgi:hypothetical protein